MQTSALMDRRTPNVFHPAFQIHCKSLHAVGRIARADGLLRVTKRQRFAVTEAVKSQQRVLEKAHAEDLREEKSDVVAEEAEEAANKDRQRGILLLNLLVSTSGSPDEHRSPLVASLSSSGVSILNYSHEFSPLFAFYKSGNWLSGIGHDQRGQQSKIFGGLSTRRGNIQFATLGLLPHF